MKWSVVVALEGMQQFACVVEADCSRDAQDRAWGLFAESVAHPTRTLSEHRRGLMVHVVPHDLSGAPS